MFLTVKK